MSANLFGAKPAQLGGSNAAKPEFSGNDAQAKPANAGGLFGGPPLTTKQLLQKELDEVKNQLAQANATHAQKEADFQFQLS